jgi:branched-chain amino acid transport system substrate-binding protein
VRTFRSRPARAAIALASASLFLSACGAGGDDDGGDDGAAAEGDTTGITDSTIKVGAHMPLTGVAAPGYSEIPQGQKAYLEYVNANGGVCDRQFEYIVRDDGYNPSNTVSVTNQLVQQDEIALMLGGLGTPTHSAVLDFLNEQGVPDLFVSSGAKMWNQPEEYPFTFGWQPDYTVEGKILGQYIAENLPDAKVGLYLQGDELGVDGSEGLKMFIEDQIVAEVTYTVGSTDVGPQIGELQRAGADFVVGFNVPTYTALSLLTAQRLNYNPTWAYSSIGSDPTLVGTLLSNISRGAVQGGGALEGKYTLKYLPTVEQPDDEWTQLFTRIWEEHGENDQPLSNFRLYGMSEAYTLVQAIVDSCDNLTREGIVETIEQNGAEWVGPWLAPLEYSEESHRGITGVGVARIENGEIVPQAPVMQTDSANEEAPTEVDEAVVEAVPDEDGIPNASE